MKIATHPKIQSDRIMSIDALRGFDMFWIVGGHGLVLSAAWLLMDPLPEQIKDQFEHAQWDGFTVWDLIMPLFLFIVGTSMPFAFAKRRGEGQTTGALYRHMLRRVVVLFVLGMIVQGHLLAFKLDQLHIFSNTLQAIAVGYCVAGLALLHLAVLGQVLLAASLLVAYWGLMVLVPFDGHPAGTLEAGANLALYIDHLVLGRFEDGTSYTWVLSGLGFGATVLMGAFSGHVLRWNRPPAIRTACLFAAGLGCLLAGWLWSGWFPINKHIWTSSMALWAGGWSFLLLAIFYLVIDVWGFRRWAFPFVVLGTNAITAYVGWHLISFHDISRRLLGGLAGHLSERGAACFLAGGAFVTLWLILFHMHRHRIVVKV